MSEEWSPSKLYTKYAPVYESGGEIALVLKLMEDVKAVKPSATNEEIASTVSTLANTIKSTYIFATMQNMSAFSDSAYTEEFADQPAEVMEVEVGNYSKGN